MSFSTILFTEKGRALQAKALAGATLKFTKIAMGSGSLGGQNQITLNDLIELKVILDITEVKRNANYATIKGVFRNQDINTGFYWREIGLYAQDPDIGEILYCYGNSGTLAEYIPPQTSEIIEKVVSISAIVGDTENVTAIIDESLVYASKKDLEEVSQAVKEALNKADEAFWSASNGKAAIKAAITGVDPSVTIPNDATFAQLATAISQIKTGVNTDDATATAEQILAGMTAYVKGAKVTGTMANRGAVNQSLPINGTFAIPAGYHNGSGKVTQSITTKAAATYTPGTIDQTIAAGQYLSGAQTIKGDANLKSSNIVSGVSIFGVAGSAILGMRYATGTATNPTYATLRVVNESVESPTGCYMYEVTGLSFSPRIVVMQAETFVWTYYMKGSIYVSVFKGYINLSSSDNASKVYVTDNGFRMPMRLAYANVTWYAWE